MQITIKKVADNGHAMEGVTVNVSVKELVEMDNKGIHLFGTNNPEDPEGFPEEEVDWDECCLNHEPVKKITCKTFLHKYNSGKVALVKIWLADNDLEYRKNSGVTTEYIEYDLDIYQIGKLYAFLSSSEDGTNAILI